MPRAQRTSDNGAPIRPIHWIILGDGNIAIAGGRTRGTLYGVYTFLEDYCGARFLTPDNTHVPELGGKCVVKPVEEVSICAYRGVLEPICALKEGEKLDPAIIEYLRPIAEELFRLCETYGLGGMIAAERERMQGIVGQE